MDDVFLAVTGKNIGRWSVTEITALVSRNRKTLLGQRNVILINDNSGNSYCFVCNILANVYKDSFVSATKDMIDLSNKIINGTVAAQLAAALIAVSCVTITFCVNLTMVQDRASGARKRF